MPTWVLYNLQPPTDGQVNGMGFYRTVTGGSAPSLITRTTIPDNPIMSITQPWEAAFAPSLPYLAAQFITNEQMIWVWPIAGRATVTASTPSTAVAAKGQSISICQTWESENFEGTKSDDVNGNRATHRWETRDSTLITTQNRDSWALASTTTDVNLGAAIALDNSLPPLASKAAIWQEHVWLAGNTANPNRLFYSKRFLPEAFPSANFIDIGNADDPITAIAAIAGVLGVFTRNTKYRITGSAASGFVATEGLSRRGCLAPQALVVTDIGAIFVAHDGIFTTNFISPDKDLSSNLLPMFLGKTVNDVSPINWDQINKASAAFWKNRYYFAYAETGQTQPNRMAVFSFDTSKWQFYNYPTNIASLFVEEDVDQLVSGSDDGNIYILENGTDDTAGSNVSLESRTKKFHGGTPTTRSLFIYIKVDADTKGDNLNTDVYIDDVLIYTAVVNGNRNRLLIPLPENTWGYNWQMRFRYSGNQRIEIYGAAMLSLPLQGDYTSRFHSLQAQGANP